MYAKIIIFLASVDYLIWLHLSIKIVRNEFKKLIKFIRTEPIHTQSTYSYIEALSL